MSKQISLAIALAISISPVAPVLASEDEPPQSPLTILGDFRLRAQGDYSRDVPDRNSAQIRARFGATYAVNDRVTLGARLATGDPDDPNSTDVQLSSFNDDLQVSFDLAYVQLNLAELKLHGGKIPQPFVHTDLVWDGDVNPQGASAVYKHALAGGGALRASSLFFLIDEQSAGPESTMVGGQFGYESAAGRAWRYEAYAGYYDYRLGSIAGADAGDFRSNLRNADGTYRSDFDLADVIIGASWHGAGEHRPVRLIAELVRNLGSAASADSGYDVELSVGRTSAVGDWRVTYARAAAGTDAVFAAFSHDNLILATNYELHSLTFDCVPWPKTTLGVAWYHYKPQEAVTAEPALSGRWLDRLRVYFHVAL